MNQQVVILVGLWALWILMNTIATSNHLTVRGQPWSTTHLSLSSLANFAAMWGPQTLQVGCQPHHDSNLRIIVPYPLDPCMVYMLTFGVYKWQMLPYMAYIRILWDSELLELCGPQLSDFVKGGPNWWDTMSQSPCRRLCSPSSLGSIPRAEGRKGQGQGAYRRPDQCGFLWQNTWWL